MLNHMQAQKLFHKKKFYHGGIIEMVIWRLPNVDAERPHGLKYRLVYVEPGGLEFKPRRAKYDDRRQQNICVLEHDFLQAGVPADPDNHRPHDVLHGDRQFFLAVEGPVHSRIKRPRWSPFN